MKLISGPVPFVAWRCIVLICVLLGTAAAILLLHQEAYFLPAGAVQVLIGVVTLAAWIAAIRFILADTWGRWFWLVVLAGAAALALFVPGSGGIWLATSLSVLVLTCRQYRPWRHIGRL